MKHKYIILASFLAIFAFSGNVSAQEDKMKMEDSGMMVMEDGTMMMNHSMGPLIADRMLHAWVSLLAAIIIFIIALFYMTGGQLSRPIMLIGFGALGDALVGLVPQAGDHMQWMWLGSLIFGGSVVLGIIWMGKIFGVFAKKTQ